jgi:nitrous oxidase accessory protein NosD
MNLSVNKLSTCKGQGRNNNIQKSLVLGIILLFIGVSVVSSYQINSSPKPSGRGWLYVGGSGPGNYSTIQCAIDAASNDDTVYVYSGTYYEHVVINKWVNLIGEDRNNTVIDGNRTGDVVVMGGPHLKNFTIRNSEWATLSNAGINFVYSDSTISNCSIYNCSVGCYFTGGLHNVTIVDCDIYNWYMDGILGSPINSVIKNCKIHGGTYAMEFGGTNNTIDNCSIYNTPAGCYFGSLSYSKITNCKLLKNGQAFRIIWSWHNVISDCIISDNNVGISLEGLPGIAHNNTIRNNTFKNNQYGIGISSPAVDNYFFHNNFINNTVANGYDESTNFWDNGYPSGGNYWSDYTGNNSNHDGIGDTPYNISGGNNTDRYPLMYPFEKYTILRIVFPNISIYEGEDFPIVILSLADIPIPDVYVKFNNVTLTTNPNGTVWFTAPQIEKDTLYDVSANKTGYTEANEMFLIKNMMIAYVFGKITNVSQVGKHIQFEAIRMRVITFPPFCFNSYFSGEKFTIYNEYQGFVGKRLILVHCKILA